MNRKQDVLCKKCGKETAVVGLECASCLLKKK
jgi:ribosomal protein L37E